MSSSRPWTWQSIEANNLSDQKGGLMNTRDTRTYANRCLTLAALLLMTLACVEARAEHAGIDLTVIGPDGQAAAQADEEPPVGGQNPRPKLVTHAGDPLVLQFFLTNKYPHATVKNVSVRYFVLRTGDLSLKTVPNLKRHAEDVVTQGKVTMNFKPDCRVGTRLQFQIDQPGIYLVRVETQNTQSDHEHFSAIDLVVE